MPQLQRLVKPGKGIFFRHASPSSHLLNNSTTLGLQSDSHRGKNLPERKGDIMGKLVVPVEE